MSHSRSTLQIGIFLTMLSFAESFNLGLRPSSLHGVFRFQTALSPRCRGTSLFSAAGVSMVDYQSLTVKDLREKLVSMGEKPPAKAKKADLLEMLSAVSDEEQGSEIASPASSATPGSWDVDAMTVPELKDELRARGLKVGGKKSELTDRLREALSAETAREKASSAAGFTDLESNFAESTEVVDLASETYAEEAAASASLAESTEEMTQFDEEYDEGPVMAEAEPEPIPQTERRSQPRSPPPSEAQKEEDSLFEQEWAETTQVFVRGIPFRARPQDLVELFEAGCGIVTRIEGMFFNGRASGRAWVTFEDKAAADAALLMDREEMEGRFIEVYPPWSRPARQALRQVTEGQGMQRGDGYGGERGGRGGGRGGRGGRGGYGDRTRTLSSPKCERLFIGRIPLAAQEEDVVEALEGVAGVVDVRMGFRDGEFKGYAHVQFEDEDQAEEALVNPIVILGRTCRADFAAPRRNDQSRTRYR